MAHSVLLLVVSLHLVLLLNPAGTTNLLVEDLTNRNADFGARLYRAVASRTDDNIFLSPFALSAGLLALLQAASGATQEQLLQGLTLTGLDTQTLPGTSVYTMGAGSQGLEQQSRQDLELRNSTSVVGRQLKEAVRPSIELEIRRYTG